jgi:hypothetical protein
MQQSDLFSRLFLLCKLQATFYEAVIYILYKIRIETTFQKETEITDLLIFSAVDFMRS